MRHPFFATILVVGLLVAELHATNGLYRVSVGARATGRGGADIALSDDAFAILSNPAGMAFVMGHRMDLNFGTLRFDTEFETSIDKESNADFGPAGDFATFFSPGDPFYFEEAFDPATFDSYYVDPLGDAEDPASLAAESYNEEMYGSRFRIGFGVTAITGSSGETEIASEPLFPDGTKWESNILVPAFIASAALRVTDWLSIGVSFDFVYAQFEVDSPLGLEPGKLGGMPQSIGGGTFGELASTLLGESSTITYVDIDDLTSYGFGGRIGVMVRPIPEISIGFVYRPPTYFLPLQGEVTTDFTREFNDMINPNNPLGFFTEAFLRTELPDFDQGFVGTWGMELELELPQQIKAGIAISPTTWFTFAFDFGWTDYSSSFQSLSATLTDGDNPNLNIFVGSDQVDVDINLEWEDQFILAFGVTLSPTDWLTLRAGYNYGNNPVKEEKVSPGLAAIIEHHVTVGSSVYWGPWSFDFGMLYGFENSLSVDTHDSLPELDGASVTASALEIYFGLGLSF